jgi:hypothetical protein
MRRSHTARALRHGQRPRFTATLPGAASWPECVHLLTRGAALGCAFTWSLHHAGLSVAVLTHAWSARWSILAEMVRACWARRRPWGSGDPRGLCERGNVRQLMGFLLTQRSMSCGREARAGPLNVTPMLVAGRARLRTERQRALPTCSIRSPPRAFADPPHALGRGRLSVALQAHPWGMPTTALARPRDVGRAGRAPRGARATGGVLCAACGLTATPDVPSKWPKALGIGASSLADRTGRARESAGGRAELRAMGAPSGA